MANAKTRRKKAKTVAQNPAKQAESTALMILGMDADNLIEFQDGRVADSKTHWDGKDYKLEEISKENERLYYGRQVSDSDDGSDDNLSLDNRIFSSMRTIVPYVTTRITEPEVYPSSTSLEAKHFAEDLEKALFIHAKKQGVKQKVKNALEDAMVRRRGYLKPRYDSVTGNFCAIEYVPAESIIMDHKARPGEEPRYFRHILDKSAEDLIVMFPDMKQRILTTFKIDNEKDRKTMTESHKVNEDWFFTPVPVEGEDGETRYELDLLVSWSYNKVAFGIIQDPNWRYDDNNFLEGHMMPLVFFNVLNDGRSYVDKTSYVEQAKYAQYTIDKRGQQIGENAGLGSVGMPVVDSAALADDQAQYLQYESDTVIELDLQSSGASRIGDVFDTWKAEPLSPEVYKDKVDAIDAVQNAFGASNVFQGQESDAKTLGQDVLSRDQSMGRQQEIVEGIDTGMNRLYRLVAQFLLVYGDEKELFKFVGENNTFDYIVMNTDTLDTDSEIWVKGGTSMPIDNPQRRATADAASQRAMIDPLTYWEIMDEPNAQKYAKRITDWKTNPMAFLADTQEELFDRDAFIDIEIIKQGGQPPFRDNPPKEYYDYLNQYVVSGNLESPKIPLEARQAISQFIDAQLARAQSRLGMAETQLPTEQDVAIHNQKVDEANGAPGADAGAGGGSNESDPAVAAASQLAGAGVQ